MDRLHCKLCKYRQTTVYVVQVNVNSVNKDSVVQFSVNSVNTDSVVQDSVNYVNTDSAVQVKYRQSNAKACIYKAVFIKIKLSFTIISQMFIFIPNFYGLIYILNSIRTTLPKRLLISSSIFVSI